MEVYRTQIALALSGWLFWSPPELWLCKTHRGGKTHRGCGLKAYEQVSDSKMSISDKLFEFSPLHLHSFLPFWLTFLCKSSVIRNIRGRFGTDCSESSLKDEWNVSLWLLFGRKVPFGNIWSTGCSSLRKIYLSLGSESCWKCPPKAWTCLLWLKSY